MEDFEELNALYRNWRTRNRDYAMQAAQFVRQFAAEIAKQIGAPEFFTMPDKKTKVPYVRPLKFDPHSNRFDALGRGDTLLWDDDNGVWEAGVGIHLQPGGERSFPDA
jgi:hypothetical protein